MNCLTRQQNKNLLLNVYVQPRASKNRIAGMHGNAVKVCVTAPPVENKANEAVKLIIADLFNIPRSAVSIKSGRQGRNKKVLISSLSLNRAREVLSGIITPT